MELLEQYFRGDYREEKQTIKKIGDLVSKIFPLFNDTYSGNGWPYEVVDNEYPQNPKGISYSTTFMIFFTIVWSVGYIREESESLAIRIPDFNDQLLKKIWKEQLKKNLFRHINESNNYEFASPTYGVNNPFTLSWVIELLISWEKHCKDQNEDNKDKEEHLNGIIASSKKSIERIFKDLRCPLDFSGADCKRSLEHVFPLLKCIHLHDAWRSLTKILNKDINIENSKDEIHLYLSNRVHQHLSYFNIIDSNFDAAELVFALEGLLILGGDDSIDRNLINRVFGVLKESQLRNPYWRPLKPFAESTGGGLILALSVEIATSMLRICRILREKLKDNYFSQHIDLFKRYTEWLFTRIVRITTTVSNKTYSGWQSEHITEGRRIHLWQTSQVVIYLLSYKTMLQEHIAQTVLKKSKLSYRDPEDIKDIGIFDDDSRKLPEALQKIKENFIDSRKENNQQDNKLYSMLLYGPPGTGKTMIARELAKSLGWGVITITPSDFIARGEAEVENRAKKIFDVLEEQKDAVILFDEIDRLILDRDSGLYGQQSDIFQFMTPSMLVKLKNLREKEKVIFIIATNYEERIDFAAKRVGRIDKKFLIIPPNKDEREKYLCQQILEKRPAVAKSNFQDENLIRKLLEEKVIKNDEKDNNYVYFDENIMNEEQLKERGIKQILAIWRASRKSYLNKTVLYTHSELKQIIDTVYPKLELKNLDNLIKGIDVKLENGVEPATIRLTSYKSRFLNNEIPQKPYKEFFSLLLLKKEAEYNFYELPQNEKTIILKVLDMITPEDGKRKMDMIVKRDKEINSKQEEQTLTINETEEIYKPPFVYTKEDEEETINRFLGELDKNNLKDEIYSKNEEKEKLKNFFKKDGGSKEQTA